ncbi:hypothetical protein [Desulfovibrio sp. TomC]|uniref:hypothetical protein n=1 Tax=Desulfovibrio sp. TomC TaxID=1562888 RepID=UPI00057368AF|nr:hypothetical protein [Desulfovibrio sp. TomC]KHK02063.1 hypothetical protein NY78_2547 [Desulfovibrio sp. TomC]
MSDPIYTSVAFVSGDSFAVSNAAGEAFTGEFVPGLRVWGDCQADGIRLGTVTTATHDAGAGRTLVTVAVDAGAALTPNLTAVLHGNDIPESLCSHADNHTLGGRDPLPSASTTLAGLVRLALAAETQAGANTGTAVTPAGLATAAKGLLSANTTIHVATTGSDVSGTGAAGMPFASISKALGSIAGKLIASGVTVTIQVADGTYAISSTIAIDHPDADKIQILGNTSAETTVAIASIDTAAKTFTVAGNYVSNADAAKNIVIGDIIGLTGSSTSGLNGGYLVSGVNFDGVNTAIVCSAEALAAATVGGGSIVIKPCNRCKLLLSGDIHGFYITSAVKLIDGFKIVSSATWNGAACIYGNTCRLANIGRCNILTGAPIGVYAFMGSVMHVAGLIIKNVKYGAFPSNGSFIEFSSWEGTALIDSAEWAGIVAYTGSTVYTYGPTLVLRNCQTPYSPALNTSGNANSFIQQ